MTDQKYNYMILAVIATTSKLVIDKINIQKKVLVNFYE